jgi:hypothetical protein
MDFNRIPNNLLNYRPHGKRSLGRPLKRWSETVTGHLAYYLMMKKKLNQGKHELNSVVLHCPSALISVT